jgi:hypothetical protein
MFLRNTGNHLQVYTASQPKVHDPHFHHLDNLKSHTIKAVSGTTRFKAFIEDVHVLYHAF